MLNKAPNKTQSLTSYFMVATGVLLFMAVAFFWIAQWVASALWLVVVAIFVVAAGYIGLVALLINLVTSESKLILALGTKKIMALRMQVLILFTLLEALTPGQHRRLQLQQALILLNNQLIDACDFKTPFNRILVLTPHCIQRSKCQLKVTGTEENNFCTECGLCNVGTLKALGKKYGIQVAIATGGTLARKLIQEARPKFVIAIACERDLVSGLKDASQLPVYAITNVRPHGPCTDTSFDAALLQLIIEQKGQ